MKTATITTSRGTIVADLFDAEVPGTVANFEKLANEKFYDGTRFHRVIDNFMIQGGDPLVATPIIPASAPAAPATPSSARPRGTPTSTWPARSRWRTPARTPAGASSSSAMRPQPHLDGVHTVFGQVTTGLDIVNAIRKNDVIESIRVA